MRPTAPNTPARAAAYTPAPNVTSASPPCAPTDHPSSASRLCDLTRPPVPGAVGQLGSATGAYARVGVTWDAVTGATGYTVQWKSGEESFSSARETAVTTNSATVSPLANGAAFMVRVSASNTAGDSEWSGAVTATTPVLAAPANVVVTRGDGRLDVSWDAVEGAEQYTVQWTSGGRPFADSREITAETNAATVPDLANGTTYTLRVRAANAGGESDWSATETGMPQVPAPETPENLTVTTGDTTLAVRAAGRRRPPARRRRSGCRGTWR